MKPLKLQFEGIRSFSEMTKIDFEPLTRGGLFGIFGSTGSGKSTILDAIIIALYGGLSGLNMAEIVSTRRKKASVCFDFSISDRGNRKTYRVERSFSLGKDGAYKSSTAYLYELVDGSVLSIAEKTNEVNAKIESIIGLGQSEFTKCIILPQGEFSTFVKATKAERVKIIEKLFDLEKYGDRFNAKLKNKMNTLEREIASVKGALNQFEGITEEAYSEAVKEVETCNEDIEQLTVKQKKIADYIEENQKFYNIRESYLNNLNEYNGLLERKADIDEKERNLLCYEKAKLVSNVYGKYLGLSVKKQNAETALKKAKEEYINLKEKAQECQKEYDLLESLESEEKQLLERKQNLAVAKNDAQRLSALNQSVKKLTLKIEEDQNLLVEKSGRLTVLKQKLIVLTDEIKTVEGETSSFEIFSFVADGALKEEYDRQTDYYGKEIKKVNVYNDGSSLFAYVSAEYENRREFFVKKAESLSRASEHATEEAIAKYNELSDKKANLEKQSSDTSVKIAKLEEEVNSVKNLIALNGETLVSIESERNSLIVKLSKITDNIDNFDEEFVLVCDKIKFVAERQETIRKSYKEINDALISANGKLSKTELEFIGLNKDFEQSKESYETLYGESEIDGEKANAILSGGDDADEIKTEIENYRKRVEFLSTSIEIAKTELEKSAFSAEEYEYKRKELTEIGENREQFIKILGNLQNNVEKLSQKLKERCIIEKELLNFTARMGVYERLGEAIGRKSFTEFIASEFLSDVAIEARKTLIELTGGKYDVVYRDSSSGKDGFFVLDNLNGGVERSVSSLSGGETFLVSLSLALALSVNIYASSDKPMEFFFLDEGFGTLDEELVETVLDSLERLKNKNFTIGLISHLAEMKSRIDSKITVTPANEITGSTVKQTE